jgi:acyl-CoA synthetase (AMP-forming)/AMP-acid ligase II
MRVEHPLDLRRVDVEAADQDQIGPPVDQVQVTVGGFNVYPAEVENAILGLDGVVECAVVGAPDERLGEVGRAYIVGKPGHSLEPEAVIAACRERLANFKVPRRVEIVDELPHNAAGKVLKTELRERAAAR